MSNYTKSFNFRNGVQVDDSSLVVNANGLVGIGTTRPEKKLDVFGNARVSGLTSVSTLNVTDVVTIGTGITMDSATGIVTAVKFVGDASGLQNIVAIATDGWIQNAGSLSTAGNVGIGTTIFTKTLEVKGESKFFDGTSTFESSIISKDINSTGVITATDFAGAGGTAAPFVNINVGTAATIGVLTVTDGSTFNGNVLIPDNKRLKFGNSGVEIFHDGTNGVINNNTGEFFIENDLNSTSEIIHIRPKAGENSINAIANGSVELYHDNDKKFETTGTGVTVTGNLGVSQKAILNNLEVSGISTFNNDIELKKVSVGATVGFGKSIFMATNASIFLGDFENLQIFNSGTDSFVINKTGVLDIRSDNNITLYDKDGSKKSAVFDTDGSVNLFHNNVSKFETIGLGVSVYGQLNVASLNGGTNGLSASYGALRYGNESNNFAFSTRKSVDLLNYDTGNINFYLDGSNINSGIGSFIWHKGLSSNLMILTQDGNLGIGEMDPEARLHVNGNAKISGLSTFSSGIDITGGNIVVTNSIKSKTLNTNFDFTTGIMSATTFKGDIDAEETGGTSIFNNLIVKTTSGSGTGIATIANLKVGSALGVNAEPSDTVVIDGDNIQTSVDIKITNENRIFVTDEGQVGIYTNTIPGKTYGQGGNIGINARDVTALVKAIGVGTADFGQGASVDFSNAGNPTSRYMIPPVVNATERAALVGPNGTAASIPIGAIIFDTSNEKLRYFTGNTGLGDGGWVNV